MGFGWPTRYVQLDVSKVEEGSWDDAVEKVRKILKNHQIIQLPPPFRHQLVTENASITYFGTIVTRTVEWH